VDQPLRFSRVFRRALLVLLFFGAVSSLAGGVLGVFMNGAGVPLAYLESTPFTSYLVPGLILAVVIGGTQMSAAVSTLKRADHSNALSAVAGFGMIIWIFVELALMSEYSWLQTVYFAVGVAELALVFGVLGIFATPSDKHIGVASDAASNDRLARASMISAERAT